jgi:hypothetical protein
MSDLKRFYDKLASKEITFDQYKEFSLSYNDLVRVYSNIDSALSNIDYIETIDNQNDLSNLNNFLEKNINISLSTKIKGYQNTGSEKNNEFKKTIPDSFRKLITEKQNLDYELYEKVKMGYYKE